MAPEETLDIIETRISFFKMFKARGFVVFAPDLDRVFDDTELATITFQQSQLKNNSKLVLREPSKKKVSEEDGSEELDEDADFGEEGEHEMMEEGGEDEFDEMPEEGEAEQDEAEAPAEADADAEAEL